MEVTSVNPSVGLDGGMRVDQESREGRIKRRSTPTRQRLRSPRRCGAGLQSCDRLLRRIPHAARRK